MNLLNERVLKAIKDVGFPVVIALLLLSAAGYAVVTVYRGMRQDAREERQEARTDRKEEREAFNSALKENTQAIQQVATSAKETAWATQQNGEKLDNLTNLLAKHLEHEEAVDRARRHGAVMKVDPHARYADGRPRTEEKSVGGDEPLSDITPTASAHGH